MGRRMAADGAWGDSNGLDTHNTCSVVQEPEPEPKPEPGPKPGPKPEPKPEPEMKAWR